MKNRLNLCGVVKNEDGMKTKECPGCGWEVEADSSECKYCQYEFPQTKRGYMLLAVVLIVVFLWMIFF